MAKFKQNSLYFLIGFDCEIPVLVQEVEDQGVDSVELDFLFEEDKPLFDRFFYSEYEDACIVPVESVELREAGLAEMYSIQEILAAWADKYAKRARLIDRLLNRRLKEEYGDLDETGRH